MNKKCSHKKPLQAEIEITGVSPGEYRLSKPQALEYQEIKLINVYIYIYFFWWWFLLKFSGCSCQAVFRYTQQGSAEMPELQVTDCHTERKSAGKCNLHGAFASTVRLFPVPCLNLFVQADWVLTDWILAAVLLRKQQQQVNTLTSPRSRGKQPLSDARLGTALHFP